MKNLRHEESQAFEQFAKRGYTVSILGGFPNPTGWSSKQHGLTLLCARVWTSNLLRFLPTWAILWLYDHRMCIYSKWMCECSSSWHAHDNFKVDIAGTNSSANTNSSTNSTRQQGSLESIWLWWSLLLGIKFYFFCPLQFHFHFHKADTFQVLKTLIS